MKRSVSSVVNLVLQDEIISIYTCVIGVLRCVDVENIVHF